MNTDRLKGKFKVLRNDNLWSRNDLAWMARAPNEMMRKDTPQYFLAASMQCRCSGVTQFYSER